MLTLANDLKTEAFSLISTVKQFSKETSHSEEQKVVRENCLANDNLAVFIRVQREFFTDGFKYILLASMMYYEMKTANTHFGPGEFLTFYLLIESFLKLFASLNWHLGILQEDIPAIESYVDFMETPNKIVSGRAC